MQEGLELVFGPDARRLEPRAVPLGTASTDPGAPPWDAETVRAAFRAEGEPPASLRALRGADLDLRDPDSTVLTCSRAELAELAETDATAAVLLRAHDSATRPPAPPRLMGVLNVTPDSFSDGGRYLDPERAADRAEDLVREGAELLDVGGESTRPGADPVDLHAELDRVLPAIEAIRERELGATISIDTRKAEVARRALDAGAALVNDVSAGRHDPEMLASVADRGCPFVAMHMQGSPRDMQDAPSYRDPVREILEWLRGRAAACLEAGIGVENLILDPGIGFGKRLSDNVALVRRAVELRSLGLPLLFGVSRKAFLGRLTGVEPADKRVGATVAAVGLCVAGGVELLRVHDVGAVAQGVAVARAHAGLLPRDFQQP